MGNAPSTPHTTPTHYVVVSTHCCNAGVHVPHGATGPLTPAEADMVDALAYPLSRAANAEAGSCF